MSFSLHAPAKLNLFLHVTGKRPDGYHLLDSLVAFTEFGDTLEFHESDRLSLEIAGEFASALNAEENLVMKAARMLRGRAGVQAGARIILQKRIPVGAGLGGGSADAAAALKGLGRLWNLGIPEDLPLHLGSDVPVCMLSRPCLMRGAGEDISPVDFSPRWLLLLNPRTPLPTADVFARYAGPFRQSMGDVNQLAAMHNDLQESAMSLCPAIADMLDALASAAGCRLARMSGSGATCFGLFDTQADAAAAERSVAPVHPGWWRCVTRTAL